MIAALSSTGAVSSGRSGGSAPFDYSSVPGYTVDVSADFVVTSGSLVTDFIDQALAHDYSQATTTNQPTREATGWGADNSPSVLFDGVDNYVSCATSLAADLVGGTDNSCTIYLVCQMVVDNATDAAIIAFGSSASNTPIVRLADNGVNTLNFYRRDDASATLTSTAVTVGISRRLITLVYSGTSYVLRIDGTTVASGALDSSSSFTVNRAAIGALLRATAATFCNMRFKRMIGYTAEHNSTQYGQVEAALLAEHF